MFAKTANCCVPTVKPQAGIPKNGILERLTHVVKFEIARGTAFSKLNEAFATSTVLFTIVWFMMEAPDLNSATVEKKKRRTIVGKNTRCHVSSKL
jgi:hypothetical protein